MTSPSILNPSSTILNGPQCLHKLIRWNEQQEISSALEFLDAHGRLWRYTYGELRAHVEALARTLNEKLEAIREEITSTSCLTDEKDDSRQQMVPVLLPQSPALYVSLFAILETGAAFCPISLDSPPDRVKFITNDINAGIIITIREHETLATWDGGPRVVIIDEYFSPVNSLDRQPYFRPNRVPTSSDLAYIMYTSGSSGAPKGVAVSHLAVTQSLLAHNPLLPNFKRFLQFAAPSFDVSVFEIFFPLFRGVTLVGCSRAILLNDLTNMINKLDVDAAELTPTVVSSLVQSRRNVPGLKLLLTIGEMLSRPVIDEFGSKNGREGILYGMYGPTEAAIHCTVNLRMCEGEDVGNIGTPFPTVSAFICNPVEDGKPSNEPVILPIGAVGELVLAGPQLAKGYLNRPVQNAAAFVTLNGKPAYRTGDKAQQNIDGTIKIFGRIFAGQVKLRGQRVELGEIEEVVYKHGSIKTAMALVIHGVLVVFALADASLVLKTDVLSTCRMRLPQFMVPGEVEIVGSFPYLPSGKVDKRQLEESYVAKYQTATDSFSGNHSRSYTQKVISDAIKELLDVEIKLETRLASIGVDSLVAIRLASVLRAKGLLTSPIQVLQADNLESLSEFCDRTKLSSHIASPTSALPSFDFNDLLLNITSKHPEFSINTIDYVLPCSPIQDAMLAETAQNHSSYNNQVELNLPGDLNASTIQDAFQQLAEKNAILRTGFLECESSYSTFSQLILTTLPLSQFEIVKVFDGQSSSLNNISLLHPLHIQICNTGERFRIILHMHHAIYDAWSLELMLDDLESILSGNTPNARPPYRNFIEEQLNLSDTTKWLSSKEYWTDHLAHFDPRLIPNFHTILQNNSGLDIYYMETEIATTDIEATAKILEISSQSIFQAAHVLLLGLYLGTFDVCFGSVFSGRTSAIVGIEDIIGPCLSILPVRIDLSTVQTLGELAQLVNSNNRKHLEHMSLPLRDIKKKAEIQPGKALFDTLLVWQQTLQTYDYQREHVTLLNSTDYLEFNLTLEITPTTTNINMKANYQRTILPRQQVAYFMRQIQGIVVELIKNPSASCGTISMSLEDGLLSMENPIPIRKPDDSLLTSIETIALGDPRRPAIEFVHSFDKPAMDMESITYSDLNCRANRLANFLIHSKILPDDLVCICMEKSLNMYISILATIKAGAGYLPLTSDTPTDRIHHIVDEARVKIIITHSSLANVFNSIPSVETVFINTTSFTTFSQLNPAPRARSGDLAYCVFTSGSTGTPKGVLITRGNLMANLQALCDLYPHKSSIKLLQLCSHAFDVSVFEIFFTWHIGGTICSATKDVIFRDIEKAINKLGVTHLSLTPTVAALINPENVSSVEFLVTAGEAVSEKVFHTWADRGLWQGYGPSETTNICTVHSNVTHSNFINNVGPPLSNTSVFVLSPITDGLFSLSPRGAEGEFCFGGYQIGRGYLDKKQTDENFFDHPKYGRLYRSGDFGRLLPDGSLVFTGRKDDQVKIRGHRIELGEINAVLLRYDVVKDCITMAIRSGGDYESRLVCFWTGRFSLTKEFRSLSPDTTTTSNIYSRLTAALPGYMIPTALIPISQLPFTSQGKIDKRLLIDLFKSLDGGYLNEVSCTRQSLDGVMHVWSETELKIAQVVAQVARVKLTEILPNTSFFSLGIDSISAISISWLLRKSLSAQVEISDIITYPSVIQLADRIAAQGYLDGLESPPDEVISDTSFDHLFDSKFLLDEKEEFLRRGLGVSCFLPCTPLQEAMLSAAEMSSDVGTYQNHLLFSLNISSASFEKAWELMVERHEIFRTCFIRTGKIRYPYAQVVLKKYEGRIFVEGGASSVTDMKEKPYQYAREKTKWQPPYSITLDTMAGSKKLRISIHHALYDGFAMALMFEEMEMLLKGEKLYPAVSFRPFLQYVEESDTTKADAHWKTLLNEFVPTTFILSKTQEPDPALEPSDRELQSKGSPTSLPRQTTRTARLLVSESLSGIEDRIKRAKTSLLTVCQTTWALLLSKYLMQADVCFGNIVSGRSAPVKGIERLIAPCFNTIPVRARNIHNMTYVEVFRMLQAQNESSKPFHLTPLRRTQSQHGAGRLFDTLVILQPPSKKLDPSIWTIEEDSGAMDLPVVIEIVPHPEENVLELVLHVHESVSKTYDPAKILDKFNSILERALSSPISPVMSISAKASVEKNVTAIVQSRMASTKDKYQVVVEEMNTLEQDIRDVVAAFTDTPKENIKKDSSIHRLGLDSISAVQVASLLRKRGCAVIGSDVLENPSIEKLALYISKTKVNENRFAKDILKRFDFAAFDEHHRHDICDKLKINSSQVEAIRPCTAVQTGMLVQTLESMESRKLEVDYINSFSMKLEDSADVNCLLQAWIDCMKNIEMLRTGFVVLDPRVAEGKTHLKIPFVMVTYKIGYAKNPIIEPEVDAVANVSECIESAPWNLQISQKDNATVLKFTGHHALYDAQSLELILIEVASRYYSAYSENEPVTNIESLLSTLLVSADTNGNERERFWKQETNKINNTRFPDLTPLREFSTRSFVSERTSSMSQKNLEALCRKCKVSCQAAGQTAWARLLAAYSGETSITFGTVFSGRSITDDADNVPFPSIVTLPVSCSISGTNCDLLERTMQNNSQLHKHQFTPLLLIQKWAGNGNREKMFNSLFAYQRTSMSNSHGKRPWIIVEERATTDYGVSMELQQNTNGSLLLRFTAREQIMPKEQAEILLRQYDLLLRDTLTHGDSLSIDAPSEDLQLTSIMPPKYKALSAPVELLHQFVEMQAHQMPHKIALEFTTRLEPDVVDTKAWSYRNLNAEGNKIANFLLHNTQGQTRDYLVAICFDKCPDASFAILGIMKAGFAYVALDPHAPPERMRFIMEDCGATFILTSGKLAEILNRIFATNERVKVFNLDQKALLDDIESQTPILKHPIQSDDTCYCLYTSGTTGTPKGCEITHFNAVQAMMSFQYLFAGYWTENSKWLQFASFHFDVSVLEQFWSWSVGICVASAPRDLIFEDIPGAIRQLGITHIDLTPSLARLVHPNDVPGLAKGVFITGGEQLRQEILDDWGDKACIYNGYGPTEATIGVTMYPRVSRNGKPANIGPQFLNVGSFVLRPETEEPVLRGAVGELCVYGALVGKGYLNRSELSRERFPLLDKFRERVYRTGDLVRLLHNNDFLFLGRADDQVKLRGQRLELTEINEVIKEDFKTLREVFTLVLQHPIQQKEQLVTFFVPSSNVISAQDLSKAMRDACIARLPNYMVPTYFISLDNLPLSANNKADAKQLAQKFMNLNIEELQQLTTSSIRLHSWTESERLILQIIGSHLQTELDVVMKSSNIFELGVDSISVMSLSRRLQNEGYINAKISTIMQNSFITSLVKVLISKNASPSEFRSIDSIQQLAAFHHRYAFTVAEELKIQANDIEAIAPCTPAQEGMIYRFLEADHPLYFSRFDYNLDESINDEKLAAAWKTVAAKVQVLRTKFILTGDGIVQVVLKAHHAANEPVVKTVLASELESEITEYSRGIEDLDKAAGLQFPWQVSIFRSDHDTHFMCLNIFHGLYDGISLPLLMTNVVKEYHGMENIEYGPSYHEILPQGPLKSINPVEAKNFFQGWLKGWKLSQLSSFEDDHNRKVVSVSRVVNETSYLKNVRDFLGVTYQAILQVAWIFALQSLTCTRNVTFGVVLSGRSIDFPDTNFVIGPMLNTVPFSINIRDGMSWGMMITECHKKNVSLIPWQSVGLKEIQKWVSGGQLMFESIFVFQKEGLNTNENLWEEIRSHTVADYPLAFEAQLNNNEDLKLTIVSNGSVLSEERAFKLLDSFEEALISMSSPQNIVPPWTTSAAKAQKDQNSGKFSKRAVDVAPTTDDFKWNPTAIIIRSEVEMLSGALTINEHSSMLELGLDSIDFIKLSARLRKKDISLPVSEIIKSQTISKMVALAAYQTQHDIASTKTVNIEKHESRLAEYLQDVGQITKDTESILPATPLQEGMVAEMLASEFTRYFNHELFLVADDVDIERLKRAWDVVIAANGILRTRFLEIDDVDIPISFVQVAYSQIQSNWRDIKLAENGTALSAAPRLTRDAIDIAKTTGELLQLLHITQEDKHYILLSIAHALYDGWSLQIFHQDVERAYYGESGRRPSPRPILGTVFNGNTTEAARFWKSTLAGVSRAEFPVRASEHSNQVHRHEYKSAVQLLEIQAFCRSTTISIQTLGQVTWAILLASYLHRLDVLFATMLTCRDSEQDNELMFPLMNTVTIRAVLHGSFTEFLQYMQENANFMRAHQHFPLRKAQALAGFEGNLFDTLFIYQGQKKQEADRNKPLYKSISSISEVEFAICVEMEVIEQNLVFRTACKDSALTDLGTQELLINFDTVLKRIMTSTHDPTILYTPDGISVAGLPSFHQTHPSLKLPSLPQKSKHVHVQEEWTMAELTIRKVLSRVSRIPETEITKDQTIFHLGLDSISAIKVASLLRREGIKLGAQDISKSINIKDMAELETSRQEILAKSSLDVNAIIDHSVEMVNENKLIESLGIVFENVEQILPISAGQFYMLARWQLSSGSQFVGRFRFKLSANLDIGRLEQAWKLLVERQPTLRTVFAPTGLQNQPFIQLVLRKAKIQIQKSHDMISCNLLSPVSIKIERVSQGFIMILRVHHAIYDGISLPLLLADLNNLYKNSTRPTLTTLVQYKRFLAQSLDKNFVASERRQNFWVEYLSNHDIQKTAPTVVDKGRLDLFRPNTGIGRVKSIARRIGVSIDAILLAAIAQTYCRVQNRDRLTKSFVFGLYFANRSPHGEDLSRLVAPTLNLIPVKVDLSVDIISSAQLLQSDLTKVGAAEFVSTSLKEIWDWTGVAINCFINIVKDDVDKIKSTNLFERDQAHGLDLRRERTDILTVEFDQVDPASLGGSIDRAYLPAVDVELRVGGDGTSLDIGVFGPTEILSLDNAQKLAGDIGESLRGLS